MLTNGLVNSFKVDVALIKKVSSTLIKSPDIKIGLDSVLAAAPGW